MEKSYYIGANAVRYENKYFTLRGFSDIRQHSDYGSPVILWAGWEQGDTIYYSKNFGSTWTSATYDGENNIIISINPKDTVIFKGTNSHAGHFWVGQESLYTHQYLDSISFIAEGNIMSLIEGDDFVDVTTLTTSGCFIRLLAYNMGGIMNVENLILPATTLTEYCYASMFRYSIFKIPPALPATQIADNCYEEMFFENTLLEQLPLLPATNLRHEGNEYRDMFHGCHNIKISETQNANYMLEYRIPASGTAATGDPQVNMFLDTGGTFTGNYDGNSANAWIVPINTTYYTSNKIREK